MKETRVVEIVTHSGEVVPAIFTIWEESPDDSEKVRLDLSIRNETISAMSDDGYFDAMVSIRRRLEPKGIRIRCYGAAKNVYPSPMIRSMGGGDQAYKLTLGKQGSTTDLVSIFDVDQHVEPVSVETQAAFYKEWLESL